MLAIIGPMEGGGLALGGFVGFLIDCALDRLLPDKGFPARTRHTLLIGLLGLQPVLGQSSS